MSSKPKCEYHYSFNQVMLAFLTCLKRKKGKESNMKLYLNSEAELDKLTDEINSRAYKIGRSNVFVATCPKPREIWAAEFRDRIVHHLIYNSVGKWYEDRFIEDTFSCIKHRGALCAAQRLNTFCRRATNNWDKPAYYLKIDLANYFNCINRKILFSILEKDIDMESITGWLIKSILEHDVTGNPRVTKSSDFLLIPPHKSLRNCPANCGLPIGNLTSQFFSNVYMDEFDKFVKHTLRVRGYTRYVDDAVLVADTEQKLLSYLDKIRDWLPEHRNVRLQESKTKIGSVYNGVEFVGKILLPYRTYCRNSAKGRSKYAIKKLAHNRFDRKAYESAQSYIGLLRQVNSFKLRASLCFDLSMEAPNILIDSELTKLVQYQPRS